MIQVVETFSSLEDFKTSETRRIIRAAFHAGTFGLTGAYDFGCRIYRFIHDGKQVDATEDVLVAASEALGFVFEADS